MSRDDREEGRSEHSTHLLWSGLGVTALDFRCRAHAEPAGPEEPSPSHSVVLVRRGVFVRESRGETMVADANCVLFFNAEEPNRYAHPLAGGDDCTVFSITESVVRQLVRCLAPAEAERPTARFRLGHALSSPALARLHYQWLAALRRNDVELVLEDLVATLLDEALAVAHSLPAALDERGHPSARARRRQREQVEAVRVAVNADIEAPPSLAELAGGVGCSPFHLSRAFHAEAGVSLRRYVTRLRARLAAERLARGGRGGLTETALDFGYADHSHFTNSFRAEWGVSPSQFRGAFRPR